MSYLPFCESIHSKHPIVHRQLVCPFWSLLAFHEVQRVVHEALRDEYCLICPATCWSFPWQHPIKTVSNPVATLDDGHALIVLTICFWSLSILAFTSASAFLCSSSLGFLTCDGSTGGVRVAGGVVVALVVAVVDSVMMRASRKGTREKEKVEYRRCWHSLGRGIIRAPLLFCVASSIATETHLGLYCILTLEYVKQVQPPL